MTNPHQQAADKFIKEKQAQIDVLRQRMEWHQQRLQEATDPTEQEAHLGMIERDEDTLEDIRELHEKRKAFYKRHGVGLPDLKDAGMTG